MKKIMLAAAAACGAYLFMVKGRSGHPGLKQLQKFSYAHRGLHGNGIPENSMAAFRAALEKGYGIELDIHLMADGELAVIHDTSLKRTAGVDLLIEEISLAKAQEFYLEASQERVPDFEDFLKMVDGRIPLIIELKTVGNTEALCKRVMEALEGYEGVYCIESFDPSVVKWLRQNAPWVVRGQLAGHLRRGGDSNIKKSHDFLLKTLLVNPFFGGKPDFVAYKYEDIDSVWLKTFRGAKFTWTIKSYEDLKRAESRGIPGIFEQFNPKDYE